MVVQYPDKFKVTSKQDSSLINGQWQQGESVTIAEGMCRLEPARATQYIKMADGKQITFSSIAYMPLGVDLTPGMMFEVEGKVKEPVKQFSRGQLNMRAWL